jgi:hypothetical protein
MTQRLLEPKGLKEKSERHRSNLTRHVHSAINKDQLMNSATFGWMTTNLTPLVVVPLVTHAFHRITGINTAAGLALVALIAAVAVGQSRIMSNTNVSRSRWMWQTACAIGLALVAGLVAMSSVDIAGYDTVATFSGMTSAGLVLGVVQAPMISKGKLTWVGLTTLGWLIGAVVFRSIISSLAAMSIAGIEPYGLAYNAGHNELLWMATGLAIYGLSTVIATSGMSDPVVARAG